MAACIIAAIEIIAVLGAFLFAGTTTLAADNSSRSELVAIPAGAFLMGSNDGPDDERPAHQVSVAAFEIDRLPVTNARFAEFVNANGTHNKNGERLFDDDDPDARIHKSGTRRGNHDHAARPLSVAQPALGASQHRFPLRKVIISAVPRAPLPAPRVSAPARGSADRGC